MTETKEIPERYLCPIMLGLMEDPISSKDGHFTIER